MQSQEFNLRFEKIKSKFLAEGASARTLAKLCPSLLTFATEAFDLVVEDSGESVSDVVTYGKMLDRARQIVKKKVSDICVRLDRNELPEQRKSQNGKLKIAGHSGPSTFMLIADDLEIVLARHRHEWIERFSLPQSLPDSTTEKKPVKKITLSEAERNKADDLVSTLLSHKDLTEPQAKVYVALYTLGWTQAKAAAYLGITHHSTVQEYFGKAKAKMAGTPARPKGDSYCFDEDSILTKLSKRKDPKTRRRK